jgi:hypothetical protein
MNRVYQSSRLSQNWRSRAFVEAEVAPALLQLVLLQRQEQAVPIEHGHDGTVDLADVARVPVIRLALAVRGHGLNAWVEVQRDMRRLDLAFEFRGHLVEPWESGPA